MNHSNFSLFAMVSFGVLVKALPYKSRDYRFKSRLAANLIHLPPPIEVY